VARGGELEAIVLSAEDPELRETAEDTPQRTSMGADEHGEFVAPAGAILEEVCQAQLGHDLQQVRRQKPHDHLAQHRCG
jgi:hypothetical protein